MTNAAWSNGGSSGAFKDHVVYGNWVGGTYEQNFNAYSLFDASRSSSIYGSSSTVQPPAYVVHIWKRVS